MVAQRLVRALTAAALAVALTACERTAERLPPIPELTQQNPVSVEAFRRADAAAREEPSAENVGRLGMLYHAYQFHDQARRCYVLARELAPRAFRWIYYQAMLEKTVFGYEPAEKLFLEALELRPDDAELRAELGDLYLMWSRREDAETYLAKALELDPIQPTAALGMMRLLTLAQDWPAVIELGTRLLERYPRLSKAHQYLGAAYRAVGDTERAAYHEEEGVYGSAATSDRMAELYELAIPAILHGDPTRGPELLKLRCARCHDHERIYDHDEDRRWWAHTVRRMQRKAGWQWLTDDEAASVVAYLSARGS